MPGVNMTNMVQLNSWAAANKHFSMTSKPRSKKWTEDERPLDCVRKHHLRLVRRDDASYDLVLYSTTMIRYFKPEGEVSVVDIFMPWGGNANWNYIWRHGWGWGSKHAALRYDEPVWLHPYPSRESDHHSAHLVLKRGKIDTTQSWQLQAWRYRYLDSEQYKETQAFVTDRMAGLALMLELAQEKYEPQYDRKFSPLRSWYYRSHNPRSQLGDAALKNLREYAFGRTDELSESTTECFVDWYKRKLDVRYTMARKNYMEPWTLKQIEEHIFDLLRDTHEERKWVKVPIRMWRSGGNRPSQKQYFRTRAEAQQAVDE